MSACTVKVLQWGLWRRCCQNKTFGNFFFQHLPFPWGTGTYFIGGNAIAYWKSDLKSPAGSVVVVAITSHSRRTLSECDLTKTWVWAALLKPLFWVSPQQCHLPLQCNSTYVFQLLFLATNGLALHWAEQNTSSVMHASFSQAASMSEVEIFYLFFFFLLYSISSMHSSFMEFQRSRFKGFKEPARSSEYWHTWVSTMSGNHPEFCQYGSVLHFGQWESSKES